MVKLEGKLMYNLIDDETQKTVLHAIRSRFTRVYFILGVLILVVIAILVVVLVLLFTMTQMDEKYSKMANFSNREDYMVNVLSFSEF